MKIQLKTKYRLFERCLAHGAADGSSWWITHRSNTTDMAILVMILPSERCQWERTERGNCFYSLPEPHTSRVDVMYSINTLHPGLNAHPQVLQSVIYLQFDAVQEQDKTGEFVTVYSVSPEWMPDTGAKTYDPRYDMHYLSEEEMIEFGITVAKYMCTRMLQPALATNAAIDAAHFASLGY